MPAVHRTCCYGGCPRRKEHQVKNNPVLKNEPSLLLPEAKGPQWEQVYGNSLFP